MPTDNKKISAYVPDVVYDRFIQFQEEHELSMSKAATEIFAAYFGINLNPSISNESTSELQSRLEILEKALADLQESHFVLSKKVDLIQFTSELPTTESTEVTVDEDINSEPDGSLQNELPQEYIVEQPIYTDVTDKGKSNLLSEPEDKSPLQLTLGTVDSISDLNGSGEELFHKLPIDTQVNPLKVSGLSKRLKLSDAMLHKVRKYGINQQIEYTSSKDPEKRAWVFLESAKLFYPLKVTE